MVGGPTVIDNTSDSARRHLTFHPTASQQQIRQINARVRYHLENRCRCPYMLLSRSNQAGVEDCLGNSAPSLLTVTPFRWVATLLLRSRSSFVAIAGSSFTVGCIITCCQCHRGHFFSRCDARLARSQPSLPLCWH